MSDCPAYLGVTINNRLDLEELFRYDLLILCPETFDLVFKVPNWGQHPDKTFDIKLEDAKQSYDIYLTQMIFEQQRIENQPEKISQVYSSEKMSITVTVYAVVGGITSVCLVLLFIAYLYSEFTRERKIYGPYPKSPHIYNEPSSLEEESTTLCSPSNNLSQKQTVFIGFYILFRLLYSLIFTFTVFFAILMIFVEGDFRQLSKIKTYQGIKHNSSADLATKINEFGQTELLRQGELVTSMQGACSNYIGELFTSMANQMENITASQHLLDMHGQDSSISYFMHQRVQNMVDNYMESIDNFTATLKLNTTSSTEPALTKYKQYLRKIFESDWFTFPQKLFNDSDFAEDRPEILRTGSELSGIEVDFGAFLEMEEIEKVQLWPIQFWERWVTETDYES